LISRAKKILIVTGEASGDLHGAEVAGAVAALSPGVKLLAMGGENLRRAGAEIIVDSSSLAVVGITEVFGRLRIILRALSFLKSFLRREKPDLLILIDFPDFNLRVARTAKKEGIPILYYISPQVWAWRAGRIKTLARFVEKMAVIFPFEAPLYEAAGVPVEFVGHPLMDVFAAWEKGRREDRSPAFQGDPLIAILPGSREKEVSSLLPEMMRAAHGPALAPWRRCVMPMRVSRHCSRIVRPRSAVDVPVRNDGRPISSTDVWRPTRVRR
jgi:lipid-A-disaccharide synthase